MDSSSPASRPSSAFFFPWSCSGARTSSLTWFVFLYPPIVHDSHSPPPRPTITSPSYIRPCTRPYLLTRTLQAQCGVDTNAPSPIYSSFGSLPCQPCNSSCSVKNLPLKFFFYSEPQSNPPYRFVSTAPLLHAAHAPTPLSPPPLFSSPLLRLQVKDTFSSGNLVGTLQLLSFGWADTVRFQLLDSTRSATTQHSR